MCVLNIPKQSPNTYLAFLAYDNVCNYLSNNSEAIINKALSYHYLLLLFFNLEKHNPYYFEYLVDNINTGELEGLIETTRIYLFSEPEFEF
eukprot:snap_masked-scaffold_1-processed-gene-9.27-mRNA-1 protein AED:1.00 eAED:1.00 QI:0/-1/0/0/-1/1/1/0/90